MKLKKTVTLSSGDLEWFENQYPDFELSQILTLLIHEFRSFHDEKDLTPKSASRNAAKEVKAQIEEGLFDREEIRKRSEGK